jgi:hypothetical protein
MQFFKACHFLICVTPLLLRAILLNVHSSFYILEEICLLPLATLNSVTTWNKTSCKTEQNLVIFQWFRRFLWRDNIVESLGSCTGGYVFCDITLLWSVESLHFDGLHGVISRTTEVLNMVKCCAIQGHYLRNCWTVWRQEVSSERAEGTWI